jgi:hypothetical protein
MPALLAPLRLPQPPFQLDQALDFVNRPETLQQTPGAKP